MTDSRKHIVGPTERREEIARTFHPERFNPPPNASPALLETYREMQEDALSKADAILASDGEREMKCYECGHELSGSYCPACNPADGGREMVRALVEALRHEIANCPMCKGTALAVSSFDLMTWPHSDPPKTDCERCAGSRVIHAKAKEWLEGNKS